MGNPLSISEYIEEALQKSRFGILATEGDGQPHMSLIAITPVDGCRQLIFATYRSTRKFRNLEHNGKVAVLIEGGNEDRPGLQKGFVITAFGLAEEITITTDNTASEAHLNRHPELLAFLKSADCALILVKVDKYQVVHGIDKVLWWSVDDLQKP